MICFPKFGLLKSPTSPLRGSVTLEPGLFQPFSSVFFSWFLSLRRWIETFTNFPRLTTNLGAHRATPCRLEDESSRVTNATKISCYELKCSRMNFALFSSISQSLNTTLFSSQIFGKYEVRMFKVGFRKCILWGESIALRGRGVGAFIAPHKKLVVRLQQLPESSHHMVRLSTKLSRGSTNSKTDYTHQTVRLSTRRSDRDFF